MLVIISDLHLTDGESGHTISADAFRIFYEEMRQAITSACYQKIQIPGSEETATIFQPIDRCDILLNGDILDVIRSRHWQDNHSSDSLKPWDDSSSDAFIKKLGDITDAILTHNEPALFYLRKLTSEQGIEVVAADNPAARVRVYLHYMVGNHDWFYHLPGDSMNRIRQKVISAMGLSNRAEDIIPHRLDEASAETIQAICLQHRVYAQHGDLYDPINYVAKQGRDHSSLGDAIVILLLNNYPEQVRSALNLAEADPLYLKLKEIDNVRPVVDVPGWIYGVLKHHASPAQYDTAIAIWNKGIKHLVRHPFVKTCKRQLSLADRVRFWFSFDITKLLPLSLMTRITDWLSAKDGPESVYLQAAMNEAWLQPDADGKAKALYVSYGHTHDELVLPIDEIAEGECRKDQIYFNSGTWRLVHRRAQKHKRQFEYTRFHVMTYLAFYKDNERSGRPYETWSGRLGVD